MTADFQDSEAQFPALKNFTGVRDVQMKLGFRGKGIRVGIIDSGVDYRHPALGGCLGKGCLVEFGHDFVGNDNDPLDCEGHGTPVSGIIAARDPKMPIRGVAPDVTLGSYRIFGCNV